MVNKYMKNTKKSFIKKYVKDIKIFLKKEKKRSLYHHECNKNHSEKGKERKLSVIIINY